MKLPDAYRSVTLRPTGYEVPYPPLGFCPFDEYALGNGDTFGLYWPIGHEDREPLVAETVHDEYALDALFSSLGHFLRAAARSAELDPEEYEDAGVVGAPSYSEDPQSPIVSLELAYDRLQSRKVDEALEFLEAAVTVLPEFTDA